MTEAKIGVGIVGLSAKGGWAGTAHVPALRALGDDFAIVGLSASSAESAREAAEKFDVPFYCDNPAELAARPDVDLVVIAVKVPHHKELIEQVIGAGKMVYCEWPLGNGLSEAEELAALAERHGVRTFIGLQARSAPEIRFLKELIAEGQIGQVLSTTVVGSGGPPWGGVATASSVYATDRSTGASMMTIPFAHTLDGLAWVLGDIEESDALTATRRNRVMISDTGGEAEATGPDQILFRGRLENGIMVSMHYRGGFSRGTNFLWEINGTEGDIVVSGGIGHLQFGLIKLQAAIGAGATLTDLPTPDRFRSAALAPGNMAYTVGHAYAHVLDDIRQGTKTVPDFQEAVTLHRLLDGLGA